MALARRTFQSRLDEDENANKAWVEDTALAGEDGYARITQRCFHLANAALSTEQLFQQPDL